MPVVWRERTAVGTSSEFVRRVNPLKAGHFLRYNQLLNRLGIGRAARVVPRVLSTRSAPLIGEVRSHSDVVHSRTNSSLCPKTFATGCPTKIIEATELATVIYFS